ncbi:ribosomal protein L6 component of cytosolic 80S ribosome and 60S large subunit [Blastocladiella britannica]|nr:ribosomal protein L6 component of cytosolic 80S ribosome and 60S large subunit [Blastocladiella britannica]
MVAPANHFVAPGVTAFSRSKMYSLKGAWKVTKNGKAKAAAPAAAPKKTGKKTVVAGKATKFLPAEDVKKPKQSRKAAPKTAKLRENITPGTVLILLAGRFRGRRVVFLKQLESGLLLVTGPYKVNGIPIRRVAQAYVIATSTKIELPAIDLAKFTDAYFKKEAAVKSPKTVDAFFADQKAVISTLPASKVADQKKVDKAILGAIAKVPTLAKYLSGQFSLSKGQFPHLLKF